MIRKQIYIQPHQNAQLKRVAKARAMTEAEVMREALEILLSQPTPATETRGLPPDEVAWQKLLASMREWREQAAVTGKPHRWTREDYYDDERYQRPWAR